MKPAALNAPGFQAVVEMKMKGSRLNDVALLFCAIAGAVAVFAHGGMLLPATWLVTVVVAGVARHRAASVRAVCPSGDRLVLVRADGGRDALRLRSARMGGCWAAISGITDGEGRRVHRLFFADHFERPDDFRRFRRWLRVSLRPCDNGEAAGWSAWRPRWFPGNRD